MAESPSTGSGAAGIDLTQFYQVFFEEAGENLASMEQMLLQLDLAGADDEELNAIFRCAHSVKGGAATFGFADVAELTHHMETLLDKLRRHELEPQPAMVDVLLSAGDALRAQLARHQGADVDAVDTKDLLQEIARLAAGGQPKAAAAATAKAKAEPKAKASQGNATKGNATKGNATKGKAAKGRGTRGKREADAEDGADATAEAAPPAAPGEAANGERKLELTVGPLGDPSVADNLLELFKEIADLGTMEPLDAGHSADGMRRFKVVTRSSDDDLLDLFTFHVPREAMKIGPLTRGYGFHKNAPGAPADEARPAGDQGYGFFDDAPGAPGNEPVAADAPPAAPKPEPARAAPVPKPADKGATLESSTLRVSVDKVDQLVNLVGELVITQAMLAQTGLAIDSAQHQQLAAGLADLQRNTRDLQEAVMSIRMIPMSMIFNRYPRMLRDLASKLGKKVELVTQGEATELDKGLVEKITDPLTHLVRNSCDHGIELPEERIARGKPAHGTVTLAASHQGGSILIEVRDDGRGLNRDKLLKKARERGIDAPDSMSDADVWGLIFAPGFSTADVVTDVSGRGVGMDVVKKNITALNGSVEIDSAEGYGMSVKVRLPLTLAIMDGMSVGVGSECYILPLSSVVESFQVEPDTIKTVGGASRVVRVREQYMPVIDLEGVFQVPRKKASEGNGIMVIVEAEGGRIAVLVDELLGQQQVVVKNLESNYRKVVNVSGATILGDGRVALILDVGALVRLSRH